LQELGCTVQLLVNENDCLELERYDIVQVIDCDDFKILLERLPQSVFIDCVENVYLERYLEELSGWRENFNVLRKAKVGAEVREILNVMEPLFNLLDNREGKILTETEVERVLEDINEKISVKVREMTISGEGLMKMLGEGKMPPALLEIVRGAIESSGLSEHIFNMQIPVTIDYAELEAQIKRQSANEFTDLAERVKRHGEELKKIPKMLRNLDALLLYEDFCLNVGKWIASGKKDVLPQVSETREVSKIQSGIINESGKLDGQLVITSKGSRMKFPVASETLRLVDIENMFLSDAQPVSFFLDGKHKCSILTGANSGGKTTLLEHLLQNISLFQLGLPCVGEVSIPIFTDVYYFAKTKGSASKGAFETLLTQMANIRPGSSTLILADEIEAVTEPGVAGKIISATADFFIRKNCFMVLATHLGKEIEKSLPDGARIDGIEAKGLDEKFNLIVNHNPVLGRLASSTPELIVERMAGVGLDVGGGKVGSGVKKIVEGQEYFRFLFDSLKKEG